MTNVFQKPKWKKNNYRKVPDFIQKKLEQLKKDRLLVSCVKRISEDDIKIGKYKHLEIEIIDGQLVFPDNIIPDVRTGNFSKTNINGKEEIRKDLPMIFKTDYLERPNWGCWSKGSHKIEWTRQVYQRDYIPPKELDISIQLLAKEQVKDKIFIFKFSVEQVLNRNEKGFEDDLLYNLNILQENVGFTDIFPSDARPEDYLQTIHIDWEIFPVGTQDEIVRLIIGSSIRSNKNIKKIIEERYDLLMKMRPQAFIRGVNGFRRYFGAKFEDNLVVFENLEHGNAIYIMFENWEVLSKKSRIELLRGNRDQFLRIIHRNGWENQLKGAVEQRRSSASKPRRKVVFQMGSQSFQKNYRLGKKVD